MTDFPTLSYSSTCEIPTLLYTWSQKKVPLSGGASPYRPPCVSTIFSRSGCQIDIGQVRVTFKSDQAHSDFIMIFFITESKIFWIFLLFPPNFRYFFQRSEGFKADIAFIYILFSFACSLAILPQILIFVTRNFIRSCVHWLSDPRFDWLVGKMIV